MFEKPITCTYTHTHTQITCTHIPGPLLVLKHSAGMSVWRQEVVCAPGMRNLTSGLEFEPPHSSSLFSEIRSRSWPHTAQQRTLTVTESQTAKGCFSCGFNRNLTILWGQMQIKKSCRLPCYCCWKKKVIFTHIFCIN